MRRRFFRQLDRVRTSTLLLLAIVAVSYATSPHAKWWVPAAIVGGLAAGEVSWRIDR